MTAVPRPTLERLVQKWSRPRTLETPEARAARAECAADVWQAIREAEQGVSA